MSYTVLRLPHDKKREDFFAPIEFLTYVAST